MNFDKFNSTIDSFLENYIRKPVFIKGLLHLVLALYVVRLAPTPPLPVLRLFENPFFKLFIFSIVLWTAQFSPSTAILISLAFLVTMNYVNTGKVWEFLENVPAEIQQVPVRVEVPVEIPVEVPVAVPVEVQPPPPPPLSTPATAIEAVKVLADAAAAPTSTDSKLVDKITEVAIGSVATPEGAVAIKALADQAKIEQPGEPGKVLEAAQVAVNSIEPTKPVSDKVAVEAVKALAEAAVTPAAQKAADVIPVASLAVEAVKNDAQAVKAVKELAAAALDVSAANPQLVSNTAQTAIAGVTAPAPAPAPQIVVDTVSDKIAVEAVKALAEAAVTPAAQKADDIIPVANLAIEAVKNDAQAVKAVKELAAAALDVSAANPQLVSEAANTAIAGVTAPVPATPTPTQPVSDKIVVEAVKALAEAAVTPSAQKTDDVIPVANLAIEAVKNDAQAVKAVKELAAAALDSAAANPQLVTEAANTVIAGVTAQAPAPAPVPVPAPAPLAAEVAPASGCYPIRKYDISKVQPYTLNQSENYQIFTSTPQ
jgi:hypothetical protein